MAVTLDEKLQKIIDNIDAASTGKTLKEALVDSFANLQYANIPAKTLQGMYPADFVIRKSLNKTFSDGYIFDATPKYKSKKAVQSGGISDLFGDLKDVYDDYDKLFKIKET